jgi:hypothetical protein
MHRFWCGTYRYRVRGDQAIGCQSLAPGALGQIIRTTFPVTGFLLSTGWSRPVLRSTPLAAVLKWKDAAERTSPVRRSTTYM